MVRVTYYHYYWWWLIEWSLVDEICVWFKQLAICRSGESFFKWHSIFFSQATALFPVIELSYWMWGAVPSPLVIWDAWREFSKSCANYKPPSSPTPHRRLLHICFHLEKKIERKLLWKSPKSACSPSIQPCQSLDCTWRAMTTLKYQKVWQTILVRLMMGSFQPSIKGFLPMIDMCDYSD